MKALLHVSSLPLVLTDKGLDTIVECSGIFQREPQSQEEKESQPREVGDSQVKKETLPHEKVEESCGQHVATVASKPENHKDSLLEKEGPSQPQEVGDSTSEKETSPRKERREPVNNGQESWLILNGAVGDQESQPGAMVSKEDEKASKQEATVGVREDTGAEAEVEKPDLQQSSFEAGKAGEQKVPKAQEVKPQEELNLHEVGWVETHAEVNRKEASILPASWVMVTGGERQDSPLSPHESTPKGQGVVTSVPNEVVQEPGMATWGLNEGKSQTVMEMEGKSQASMEMGKSGTVEIDVNKADADPEAVKLQLQQQPSTELQDKSTEGASASASDSRLPPPKPEQRGSPKGARPETKADDAGLYSIR